MYHQPGPAQMIRRLHRVYTIFRSLSDAKGNGFFKPGHEKQMLHYMTYVQLGAPWNADVRKNVSAGHWVTRCTSAYGIRAADSFFFFFRLDPFGLFINKNLSVAYWH